VTSLQPTVLVKPPITIMIANLEGQRPSTTSLMAGVGVLLVLVVGACGKSHHAVALPTTSAPAAPSVSASPTSAEDAVRQSYTQYWAVLPRAEQEVDGERRRQLLADYAAEPQLGTVLRNIENLHAKNQTSWGYVVVHIQSVQVAGNAATVRDCQDSSNAGLMDSKTGKKTSRGVLKDPLSATLVRGTDERWRISGFSIPGHC
jgi:hypothetical protein